MKIKNLLMVFVIFIIAFTIPVSAEKFSDISETDWFYNDILSGVEHGYINGYEDGTFKPNSIVTKGEFYKMIALAFNVDVPSMETTHWAVPYAKALYREGNTNIATYPANLGVTVNRKDAIRDIIYSAGDIRRAISSQYYNEETFLDMPLPTIWDYDGYILIGKRLGIVNGDGHGYVHPEENITRAETVALIERALKVSDWGVPEPDTLEGLNIEYVGETAETFKESLCTAISKFSKELIGSFIKNNGKILVTNENPNNYYDFHTEVSGLYLAQENKIVLFTNDQSASLFFDLTGTLVHEFGHYIYDEMVDISDKKTLNAIFKDGTEPKELTRATYDNYGETDVGEFWAELVCYQLSNKMWGEADIPNSMAIVNKYVEPYNYLK